MKNFKDNDNKVHAFSDLQVKQGEPARRGFTEITEEEASEASHSPLSEVVAVKKSEIRAECESRIDAGFICSALFPDANYRNDRDQNLTMFKACKSGGKIWVNEAFKAHTKKQAEEVYDFANAEIERLRTINYSKQTYLEAPERTEAEIIAVTWDSVE